MALPIEMDIDDPISSPWTTDHRSEITATCYHRENSNIESENAPPDICKYKELTMLIRDDSWQLFQALHRDVFEFWSCLVQNSSISGALPKNDICRLFQSLKSALLDGTRSYWQKRLVHLRLGRLTTSLLKLVARDRQRDERFLYRRNIDDVIELYRASKLGQSQRVAKKEIAKQLRVSRRWELLIGDSIFLAIAFSNDADTLMYVTFSSVRDFV